MNISERNSFALYRLLCFLGGPLLFLLGTVPEFLKMPVNDPMWVRVCIMLVFLAVAFASYRVNLIQRYFTEFIYGLAFIAFAYVAWTSYLSNFDAINSVGLIVGLLSIALIFKDTVYLAFYFVTANIQIGMYSLSSPNSTTNGLMLMLYAISASLIFFIIFNQNIKDRERLSISNDYISTIFENSPEGILIANLQSGRVVNSNQQALKILGIPSQDFLIKTYIYDYFHTPFDNAPTFFAHIRNNISVELQCNRAPYIWTSVELKEVKFRKDNIAILHIADVSRERENKEQLKILNEKLENNNKELEDIVTLTSHDLKTPVRNISSLLSWALEDMSSAEAKDFLLQSKEKATKLYTLLDNISFYTSISRHELNYMEVDIDVLINKAIQEVKPPSTISINIAKKLPKIYCDESLIRLLFVQLLRNAIQYNDKPLGLITIDGDSKGKMLQLSIKDNGIGIEAIHQNSIFKIFKRIAQNEDDAHPGIGLTIAKRIVEAHHGDIWVDSEIGKGTSFFVSLPINRT